MAFRYFVIGSGSIGRRHAENLASLGAHVTLHPWRSINMNELLSDIVSCETRAGVVIATATNIRLPLITKCAAAGAALYIEKPIAHRMSDVAQILNMPQRTLERSVAGFMLRYHPMVQKLLSAQLKDIFRVYIEIGHDIMQWRQDWTFESSYAANPVGGGVLLDLCHEIDLAYLLCGVTPLISVKSTQHPYIDGVDVASMVDFASEDGRSIRVAMDYLAPKLIRRGHIVGLEQEINYDMANNSYTRFENGNIVTETIGQERNEMFLRLMADFMAIAEGRGSTNPHIPRLDRVKDICQVIAQAWEMREFTGRLKARVT